MSYLVYSARYSLPAWRKKRYSISWPRSKEEKRYNKKTQRRTPVVLLRIFLRRQSGERIWCHPCPMDLFCVGPSAMSVHKHGFSWVACTLSDCVQYIRISLNVHGTNVRQDDKFTFTEIIAWRGWIWDEDVMGDWLYGMSQKGAMIFVPMLREEGKRKKEKGKQ